MTVKDFAKLPHGTKVKWSDGSQGYVVNLTAAAKKKRLEPPLIYAQWNDGQRTDGSDEWALEQVEKA